jgi:histidyl-tRNA synthetase
MRLLEFGQVYDMIQRGEFAEIARFPNPFFHPPSTWDVQSYPGREEMMAEKAKSLQRLNPHNKKYDYSFGLDVLGEVAFIFEMNDTLAEGLRELAEIESIFQTSSFLVDEKAHIIIDPSVVRGLEYYTGPVFEAELLAPIKDERGQAIRLGSVVSGGRYDGLVERFTGEKVPATGVSIGVSRLLYGLKTLGKIPAETVQGPVVVLVLDRERMADYQKMAQRLREANIRAELYLGDSGMKAQMKYADKRGSPCVVIQGGDEKAKGEVQIKDLVLGATLTSIKDRDDYLKKQAEAQFAVPETKLVEAVRGVLARHKA